MEKLVANMSISIKFGKGGKIPAKWPEICVKGAVSEHFGEIFEDFFLKNAIKFEFGSSIIGSFPLFPRNWQILGQALQRATR